MFFYWFGAQCIRLLLPENHRFFVQKRIPHMGSVCRKTTDFVQTECYDKSENRNHANSRIRMQHFAEVHNFVRNLTVNLIVLHNRYLQSRKNVIE